MPLTEEPLCWQLFKQTCPIFIIITLGAKKWRWKKKKRKEPYPSLDLMSFSLGCISNKWKVTSVLPPYMKKGTENASTFHSDASLKIEKKGKRMWMYFKVGVVSNQMLHDYQLPSFCNRIKCHLGLLFQVSKCFDIPIKGVYQNVTIAPLECPSSGQTGVICPPNCTVRLNGVKCKICGTL